MEDGSVTGTTELPLEGFFFFSLPSLSLCLSLSLSLSLTLARSLGAKDLGHMPQYLMLRAAMETDWGREERG